MKFVFCWVLIIGVVLVGGCYGKYEEAEVVRQGSRYLVTVSGSGPESAHDPVSVLFGPFRVYRRTFDVPRIQGIVFGEEIIPQEQGAQYVGNIKFEKTVMMMGLKIKYLSTGYLGNTGWNGRYVLKVK